jgi:hypothetical protein
MLSEKDLELLTAFVDGEMTRRQRKAALRLLHRSSEARSVLQDFQENAHKLQELPSRKLGPEFVQQVLLALPEPVTLPSHQTVCARRWPRWGNYAAIAASIVVVIGLGMFWSQLRRGSDPLVKNDPQPEKSVPFQAKFQELTDKPKQEQFAKHIQKETAVHLAVAVHDNKKAVTQLQTALAKQGIEVLVDNRAEATLKKPASEKIEYIVYAENLRTAELESIMRQLAEIANFERGIDNPFDSFVVSTMSTPDRQTLSNLLGVDANEFESSRRSVDPSLFDTTIIAAPKDKSRKPLEPAPDLNFPRFAMVLTSGTASGQPASAEITRFLAARRKQQPGTVQVLFVIRST